LKTSAVG